MNKLRQIRDALKGNPNVVIVAEKSGVVDFSNYGGLAAHTVEFLVAPKPALWDASELQGFVSSLIPAEVRLSCCDKCYEISREFRIGVLNFDENIGTVTEKTDLVITDEDLRTAEGLTDGKRSSSYDTALTRRICVRVYPSASAASKFGGQETIPMPDIRSLKVHEPA